MNIVRPRSLAEALELAAKGRGPRYFLAGGTDLLVKAKDGLLPQEISLFDITGLKELARIEKQNGVAGDPRLCIGALATYDDMVRSRDIQQYAPALYEACRVVGSPQIRNRGTLGGNLGNASPAGDTVPPLYTLEAEVTLASAAGERRVPIQAFFTGPGQTVRRAEELIVGVSFPLRYHLRGTFLRLGQRQAQTISKVSIAVSAQVKGRRFEYLHIALGAVAPTVIFAERTEATLRNQPWSRETLAEAKGAIINEVRPIDDIRSNAEYRRAMCGVLLEKAMGRIGVAVD